MTKNGNLTAAVIRPDYVLTLRGLKEGWGVRVEEGWIACMGPRDSLGGGNSGEAQTACLPGQMLFPGFVNGHDHIYGVLSRGVAAEATVTGFPDYLKDFWWSCVEGRVDHDLAHIATRWTYMEVVDSGVTSFVDILEGPSSISGALEVGKEEVEKVGPRGCLSFETYEKKSRRNSMLGLKENFDFTKACNEEKGPVKGVVNIHTLFTCGGDFMREAKRMIDEAEYLFHMRMGGSDFEPTQAREYLGTMPAEAYDDIGHPDGNVLAPQLTWVTDKEITTLAERDVEGISMSLSSYEVGGKIAFIGKMLEASVTVGLGMDGYVDNFFEMMHGAFLIHKGCHKGPQAIPIRRVYRMATRLSTEAMGIETGIARKGMLTNLIAVNVARPTPINEYSVYDQLVLFTNPQSVVNMIVGGAWLKRDGKPVILDKEVVHRRMGGRTERFRKGDSKYR